MKALIVDDEVMPAKYLAALLKRNFSNITEIEIALGAMNGKEKLENKYYEILFLDVEMPQMTGFELLEEVVVPDSTKIIFTTAHEQYALKAFKANAIDYLVKPIVEVELFKAINKLSTENQIENPNDSVTVYLDNEYHVIKQTDIIRIEADGSYAKIITENKTFHSSKNLKSLTEQLSKGLFFRCHNSHVINISNISKMGKGKGGYVVLTNDDVVPVSTSKLNGLANLIGI